MTFFKKKKKEKKHAEEIYHKKSLFHNMQLIYFYYWLIVIVSNLKISRNILNLEKNPSNYSNFHHALDVNQLTLLAEILLTYL